MCHKFSKVIIYFIATLFIASSFWLFYQSGRQTDPDLNKNWWSISFLDPKSNDLSFSIENHGDSPDFKWQLMSDDKNIEEGSETVNKGETKSINLENKDVAGRAIIEVFGGNEKKEIYKNMDK